MKCSVEYGLWLAQVVALRLQTRSGFVGGPHFCCTKLKGGAAVRLGGGGWF